MMTDGMLLRIISILFPILWIGISVVAWKDSKDDDKVLTVLAAFIVSLLLCCAASGALLFYTWVWTMP